MTRYQVTARDEEPLERELDDREEAVAWAASLLSPERPKVHLAHFANGGWEQIGVFDHERGSA